ncbi:MAG TPA: hypothetical protein VEY12_04930 [Thermoplasmata archaeon]|nr:hypothetical protein [Thermoplasmata archaeon]
MMFPMDDFLTKAIDLMRSMDAITDSPEFRNRVRKATGQAVRLAGIADAQGNPTQAFLDELQQAGVSPDDEWARFRMALPRLYAAYPELRKFSCCIQCSAEVSTAILEFISALDDLEAEP